MVFSCFSINCDYQLKKIRKMINDFPFIQMVNNLMIKTTHIVTREKLICFFSFSQSNPCICLNEELSRMLLLSLNFLLFIRYYILTIKYCFRKTVKQANLKQDKYWTRIFLIHFYYLIGLFEDYSKMCNKKHYILQLNCCYQ